MCVDVKITREESLSKPGNSGLIRSAEEWCKMLDNSDTDELDLDDYYPERDLESISEDFSDEESEARSRSRSTLRPKI